MRPRSPWLTPLLRSVSVLLIGGALIGPSATATAKSDGDLKIVTLSTRPDTVSGGDVLVRIDVPRDVDLRNVKVLLNGHSVTGAFRPDATGNSLIGLVTGLGLGENSLVAVGGNGGDKSRRRTDKHKHT